MRAFLLFTRNDKIKLQNMVLDNGRRKLIMNMDAIFHEFPLLLSEKLALKKIEDKETIMGSLLFMIIREFLSIVEFFLNIIKRL